MPHTPSAKKRLRQSEDRRILNKDRNTELKSIRKKLLRAVHDGQKQEADQLYRQFSQRVDQAASVNTIHRNAAARAKARMARVIAGGPAAAAVVIGKGAVAELAKSETPRPTQASAPAPAKAAPAAKAPAKAAAPKAKPSAKKPTA
jgi:small subunit ribosomal protein S20